jgi:hypothetical protein
MQIPLEAILRRLLLTGLPLAAFACSDQPFDDDGMDHEPPVADVLLIDGSAPDLASPWPDDAAIADPADAAPEAGSMADAGGSDASDGGGGSSDGPSFPCTGHPTCYGGRRPPGLIEVRCAPVGAEVGAFFARAARMEAASVPAFRRLAVELAAHAAPRAFVGRARRAVAEEARHFRMTARLAARHGARAQTALVQSSPLRALETVAVDNAVEGCVNETYAALVALHQARAARDRQVRAALTAIAADELRHADLSWAIDGWFRARLPPTARRRLDQRRDEARVRLLASVAAAPASSALRRWAGLPDGERAMALARAVAGAA